MPMRARPRLPSWLEGWKSACFFRQEMVLISAVRGVVQKYDFWDTLRFAALVALDGSSFLPGSLPFLLQTSVIATSGTWRMTVGPWKKGMWNLLRVTVVGKHVRMVDEKGDLDFTYLRIEVKLVSVVWASCLFCRGASFCSVPNSSWLVLRSRILMFPTYTMKGYTLVTLALAGLVNVTHGKELQPDDEVSALYDSGFIHSQLMAKKMVRNFQSRKNP